MPASVDTGTKNDQLNWSYLPYIYVPLPKLLCAKFGQVLPISNWDVAQNVICKDHDLERSIS